MTKLRLGILIAAAFGCAVVACVPVSNMVWQRNSLPLKLRLGWFYAEGSCSTWSSWLSYQGAFAFSLQQETVDAIDREGMAFFRDIDAPGNRPGRPYFSISDWKESPISDEAFDRGVAFNLPCGSDQSWFWPKGVMAALKRPGSFYTDSGPRGLLVIPRLGLVVASASDR